MLCNNSSKQLVFKRLTSNTEFQNHNKSSPSARVYTICISFKKIFVRYIGIVLMAFMRAVNLDLFISIIKAPILSLNMKIILDTFLSKISISNYDKIHRLVFVFLFQFRLFEEPKHQKTTITLWNMLKYSSSLAWNIHKMARKTNDLAKNSFVSERIGSTLFGGLKACRFEEII